MKIKSQKNEQSKMTEQTQEAPQLRTNHNIRLVILDTKETILCLFGEVRDDTKNILGYRMMYPFSLSLSLSLTPFCNTNDHVESQDLES